LETDIGGSRENQDDCFVWIKKDAGLVVLCVLDGHGREVGKIASESAKARLFKHLDDNYASLLEDPTAFLIQAHEIAHTHIRDSFRAELERQGYEVVQTPEGYLMKRRQSADNWTCVHGGTSCSMVALVGSALYVANVGDSTGVLCSTFGVFRPSQLTYLADAAVAPELSRGNNSRGSNASSDGEGDTSSDSNSHNSEDTTLVLTAEHSPECPYEYQRLLRYRPRRDNPLIPALVVVYDANSHDKSRCSAVFERNAEGHLAVTNKGSYYKNVRKEWASLVSTPSYAAFQDALAFTRSLGDLHLHTYGVTHLPEVQKIDLQAVFDLVQAQAEQAQAAEGVAGGAGEAKSLVQRMAESTLCLVLATDGVWDNWQYEDVNKFVMDASCLNAVGGGVDGARRVTISFMQRNALYAKRNFGSNADNATAIVMYLSREESFPVL